MKTFYKESEDGGHSIELSKVRETETEEEEGQQDPQQLSLAYLELLHFQKLKHMKCCQLQITEQ